MKVSLSALLACFCLAIAEPSCAQWFDLGGDSNSSSGSSLEKVDQIQNMGPSRQRAVNLARATAISINGGLSVYRPASCMFSSSATGCLVSSNSEGFTFAFDGGHPGWEQMGLGPSVKTKIIISADGRSVKEVVYNRRY